MKFLAGNEIAFVFAGEDVPSSVYQALTALPLVILVGLTGVGKSTVLELLPEKGISFRLLPNRRQITDDIIIATLQREQDEAPDVVTDRVKRFEYTARYRARFPGGMAHALSRIVIKSRPTGDGLIFDGLRGLEEVQHGATYFPQARFIVLDAPDIVRLQRLLKRADAFDTTTIEVSLARHNLVAALLAVPDIEAVFSEEQLLQIARMARAADISIDTIVEKASIIVEERRNYDSAAARVFLTGNLPPERVLVVDTAAHGAEEVAKVVAGWLRGESG